MSTTIPRFLLPRSGLIWRSRSPNVTQQIRYSSRKVFPGKVSSKSSNNAAGSTTPAQPHVLEQPTKFNPPSHGSRLPRPSLRYSGPALSDTARAEQQTKKYPNMMPGEGTFMHWFLNNRGIHVWITLGVLFSTAGYTFVLNFKKTSKFADMLPPAMDLFFHPIQWFRTCSEVFRLHIAAVSAETMERRKRRVDDVQKRADYRKAHGLETEGFGGWTAKQSGDNIGPALTDTAGQVEERKLGNIEVNDFHDEVTTHAQNFQKEKKPLKKWLGIW